MEYTWEYGETDIWQHDLFDTVEDCILDAKENYLVEPGTEIVVGEAVFCEPYVSAINILKRLEENAYEEVGVVADDWYAFDYKKIKKKLNNYPISLLRL